MATSEKKAAKKAAKLTKRRVKADDPKATTWDKLSQLDETETNKYRDVYDDQQMDRSKIEKKRKKTAAYVVGTILGVLTFSIAWIVWSFASWGITAVGEMSNGDTPAGPQYYAKMDGERMWDDPLWVQLPAEDTAPLDEHGELTADAVVFETEEEARDNPPAWYTEYMASVDPADLEDDENTIAGNLMQLSLMKVLLTLGAGFGVGSAVQLVMGRKIDAQNLMHDTADINQYDGDQHVATPQETMQNFSWFPDVGAHSSVQPSSMISHVMLENKGLKKVEESLRAEEDIYDEDGDIAYYKGEILRDEHGNAKTKLVPIIDEAFGDSLFDASGLPKNPKIRKKFDATKIPYNPGGKDREKTGSYHTVADLINEDWDYPEYEVQRPGGAYIVDEAPVNTMVLAITRAGKGQTYIEPMIDMWLREKRPNNMVVNDPKGELLVKHYVRATMRGYQVVQFNLINAMKTDIYNPLEMAAEAARAGDVTKCAMYVENIADVFFPVDGGEDPVWPNAANNAFKRAAYGLIDFYMEEERELRAYAQRTGMDPKVLANKLDVIWGKVTLYNCYQLFVRLSSKKMKNPMITLKERLKAGEFGEDTEDSPFDYDAYEEAEDEAKSKEFMWDGAEEIDMLTLYFNATNGLPQNSLRELVSNADNALRSMGAAEKMLASVYGIAITAMSFFTDPTIRTLTSGRPSQNVDLAGLSFPRRFGVRFHMNYLKRDNLIGTQVKWTAYHDPMFQDRMEGEAFEHEDILSREGWARCYLKGIFPNDTAYLKLQILNSETQMLLKTLYFKFTKDYQTSLDGRRYITETVTGKKVIKDGVLVELRPFDAKGEETVRPEEAVSFRPAPTTYPQEYLTNLTMAQPEKVEGRANAIISDSVRYSEEPKAVFLVTPPHLMKYAKLILILVKQLVDLNFDQSYMTKNNQKPLYKTRFMLDELGNLQSEGQGISGFETMLSIGLGQEQQFTIILQTLQQLRDVYGESVDKIVQGNTSNIVFLKSTDDSMLETLEKMSGTRHVVYRDSKTVTKDTEQVLAMTNVEGKVSYTMSAKEEPVIKYNDLAFLPERNSIVFRAGDPPVWNRNETILPMSWRLFKDTIQHPGHDYSLQTLPTLSTALDFDVRAEQPDFEEMLAKRMRQAETAILCQDIYQTAYDYTDAQIEQLDPDVYADQVMELVDATVREEEADEMGVEDASVVDPSMVSHNFSDPLYEIEVNQEQEQIIAQNEALEAERRTKKYADKQVSVEMLINRDDSPTHALDQELAETFKAISAQLSRDGEFMVDGSGNLRSADGSVTYIRKLDDTEMKERLKQASEDDGERVYAEDTEDIEDFVSYEVTADFYQLLANKKTWLNIADGEFEREMAKQMRIKDEAMTMA